MPDTPSPSPDDDHRVVSFPRSPGRKPAAEGRLREASPVGGLEKFERGGESETDEYRHRMMANGAAAAITVALILAGLWIADALSTMRKNQDCVLSGRRGCTPVEVPLQPRGSEISSPRPQ
jgi:hypothetical protein